MPKSRPWSFAIAASFLSCGAAFFALALTRPDGLLHMAAALLFVAAGILSAARAIKQKKLAKP
jgi:hypothetical protein